jgi:uncharacterized protein (DUF488 family)
VPTERTIFTIGHSTRSFDDLAAILKAHDIEAVADVRRFPGSRRCPHFNDEALARDLPARGIAYLPFASLGGRRVPRADSPNTAWRNEAFRGYADFMMTGEFERALDELEREAAVRRTAIMCAEAVPWRCHRSLIADALTARGWRVTDILAADESRPHRVREFAALKDRRVTYPEPGLFTPDRPPGLDAPRG